MSDNNYQNRGTVKVVRQQLHEINDLRMKYNRLASEHITLAEDFASLRMMNTQLRGENKRYKVLLQVATKEIVKLKTEIVNDLKDWLKSPHRLIERSELFKLLRKWEADWIED